RRRLLRLPSGACADDRRADAGRAPARLVRAGAEPAASSRRRFRAGRRPARRGTAQPHLFRHRRLPARAVRGARPRRAGPAGAAAARGRCARARGRRAARRPLDRRGHPRAARRRRCTIASLTQELRMQVHASRRSRLAATMRAQGGGVAIVFTAPEKARNRDAHYPYRWDSHFYWLTGFPEPEAVVVVVAGADSEESILFCREKNEEREIWDGWRHGPELARERFGFERSFTIDKLDEELPKLLADQPAVWHAMGSDAALDARLRGWLDAVRAQIGRA